MTNIKAIISNYQKQLASAGLLRQAGAAQLSPQVAALRPSLTKVNRALTENPDLLRQSVQSSPFQVLFEYTLPKLEPLLVDLGENKANKIIGKLCDHGKKMVAVHGVGRAQEHLERLFKDISDFEEKIKQGRGIEEIIEAYRKLDFEGKSGGYLNLLLGRKLMKWEVDNQGMFSIRMSKFTANEDLILLGKIKKLRKLDLSKTLISNAGLKYLKGSVNLQQLNLGHAKISGAGLEHLKGLDNLQVLDLKCNKIDNAGLEHLKGLVNLRELDLEFTKVNDAGLEHLKGLFNLRKLIITDIQVSNAGLKHLKDLVNLRELGLKNNRVNDAGLKHLEKLIYLQKLIFADSQISNAGLEHLKGLVNLQELDLEHTQISDAGLEHLGGLVNLKELNLGWNQISNAGLEHLKGLVNLQALDLTNTGVTSEGINALKIVLPGIRIIK